MASTQGSGCVLDIYPLCYLVLGNWKLRQLIAGSSSVRLVEPRDLRFAAVLPRVSRAGTPIESELGSERKPVARLRAW